MRIPATAPLATTHVLNLANCIDIRRLLFRHGPLTLQRSVASVPTYPTFGSSRRKNWLPGEPGANRNNADRTMSSLSFDSLNSQPDQLVNGQVPDPAVPHLLYIVRRDFMDPHTDELLRGHIVIAERSQTLQEVERDSMNLHRDQAIYRNAGSLILRQTFNEVR